MSATGSRAFRSFLSRHSDVLVSVFKACNALDYLSRSIRSLTTANDEAEKLEVRTSDDSENSGARESSTCSNKCHSFVEDAEKLSTNMIDCKKRNESNLSITNLNLNKSAYRLISLSPTKALTRNNTIKAHNQRRRPSHTLL